MFKSFSNQKSFFTVLAILTLALGFGLVFDGGGKITAKAENVEKVPMPTTMPTTKIAAVCETGDLSGFAWAGTTGWIDMKPAQGGVSINQITGKLSGYAWSDGVGWIFFAPTSDYPANPQYAAKLDFGTMKIDGWARILSISNDPQQATPTGWIKMSDDTLGAGSYGVSMGTDGGLTGFAWSDDIGWVDFSGAQYCTPGTIATTQLNSYNYNDNYIFVDGRRSGDAVHYPGGILVYLSARGEGTVAEDATVEASTIVNGVLYPKRVVYTMTVTNLNSTNKLIDLKFSIPKGFTYDSMKSGPVPDPSSLFTSGPGDLVWLQYDAKPGDSQIVFYLRSPV